MDANPRPPDDAGFEPMSTDPDRGGPGDFARCEAGLRGDANDLDRWCDDPGAPEVETDSVANDRRVTAAAYTAYKRQFVEAGGSGPRFDDLKLLQAARLQANRIWLTLTRARGEADAPAPECEVRKSLEGFAIEADVARSKGRLRAFARRIWPFGMPW